MIDLMLMRDVFRCTPSELADQSVDAIADVLACLAGEQMVREAREKARD